MIVTYHHIDERPGFITAAESDLADHLAWIADQGFAVDLDTYVAEMLAGHDTTTMMAVTFDDAYLSFAERALPLLERYSVPATLFVPAGYVGGTNAWDYALTGTRLPLLDWEALSDIVNHPLVTIGSHGMTHRPLATLTQEDQTTELVESKRLLEEHLGQPVRHFSFPYGQKRDMPMNSDHRLAIAGYTSACSNRYGRINLPQDRYMLRRIHINPGDTLRRFTDKCGQRNRKKEYKQFIRDILRK